MLLTSSNSAQINDKIHAGIDDTTRLVYVEVLAVEQPPTVIGFISRAIAWFNNQEGIESRRAMSNNVRAYISKAFARCVSHQIDVTPFVGPVLMRVGGCGHAAAPC